MRIGVDVGGTFTDIVLSDDRTGSLYYTKASTTYPNLWEGVLTGIDKMLAEVGTDMSQVGYVVHGTTIGTNALIEKKGAKTGLITTEGFVDVLEIGRVQRPKEGLYNFWVDNPVPLVPRYLRQGVTERIGAKAQVVRELDEDSVRRAVVYLKDQGVESIAVCLLFSFLNPAHERRVGEIIEEIFPECYISLSSEIAPEFREFERTSTTVINAYLQPIMKRYINRLGRELRERYGEVDLRIMQASGGTITAETAERLAIKTVNSGPAGGALAAAFVGELTGNDKLISVDMGGTSFDIGMVEGGQPKTTSEAKFEGYPVKIPIIDVDTLGAGGGSIAWIDSGGVLNVGPESARAKPGPACYGRGGTKPTVTDANLILNRLNPDYFLGGEIFLEREKAYQAIEEHIAGPLGISVEEGAAGIIRIVNANMAKGIGVNSVEKGYDVREFSLVAFGGAGALHASELAADMGIQTVIVPAVAGNLSAMGLLVSDARYDFVQNLTQKLSEVKGEKITEAFKNLEQKGMQQLRDENFAEENIEIHWSADLCYEGQSYELNVSVDRVEELGAVEFKQMAGRFHELHNKLYAYSSEAESLQVINLRVTAIGKTPELQLVREELVAGDGSGAVKQIRPVYFQGQGFVEVKIYERDQLMPGNSFPGPAIVEEKISSTVILPGYSCLVDEFRNLIITLRRGA